jgi:hypothetical protein
MPQRDVLPRRIRVSFDEAFTRRILLQIQRRTSQPPRPHRHHLMGFEVGRRAEQASTWGEFGSWLAKLHITRT